MNAPAWNVMVATCPSRTSLARSAHKCTAMIVIAHSGGPVRFGELRQAVDGISGKVLADILRDLERDGIVGRTAYDEMPPRVEYELTALGRTLREPLTALGHWAETYIEDDGILSASRPGIWPTNFGWSGAHSPKDPR